MGYNRPITQGEFARIMALKGQMSASAAGRILNRSHGTVSQIWRGELAIRAKTKDIGVPSLSVRQEVVVGALDTAGPAGAPITAISAALGRAGFSTNHDSIKGSISHLNERLKATGDKRRVINTARKSELAMYALMERERDPAVSSSTAKSEPTHCWPVMQMNGVSLRRLSFLDGARP